MKRPIFNVAKKNVLFAQLLFVFLFSVVKAGAQTWGLVWADEFNGASINTSNWTYDLGNNSGWGNSELENYTNRAVNATVNNGNLLIIAKAESYGGSNYTSARMKTQGLHSWTYGKIQARIKLPSGGQGLWPAFWMLGDTISTIGWPKCGELDILESINSVPTIYGTAHWYNTSSVQAGGDTVCSSLTGYHVYSIEWDSTSVKWFLDSVQYAKVNIAANINNTEEFHKPFKEFILLNMAVGGNWPGNPNGSTVFPDTMYVDYVRVYQLQPVSPISGMDTLCIGSTTTLSDTTNGGVWSSGNTAIATVSATGIVSGITTGTVTISYTKSGYSATFMLTVHSCPAGIKNINSAATTLALFPDPNHGLFTLNIPSGTKEDAIIVITNLLGEKVKELITTTNTDTQIQLDGPPGMYVIAVKSSEKCYYARIVKE